MIKHSTNRWFNGNRVKPGDEVKGTKQEKDALLDCGQAYKEKPKKKAKSDS